MGLYSLFLFQKVFCGHEYSLQNLGFGLHVEPANKNIQDKIDWCRSANRNSRNGVVGGGGADQPIGTVGTYGGGGVHSVGCWSANMNSGNK